MYQDFFYASLQQGMNSLFISHYYLLVHVAFIHNLIKQYAFYPPTFYYFLFSTEYMSINYHFNVDWSMYQSILFAICLRIIGKIWGILGDISGKFPQEFLEVFEELLAPS